MPNKEPPMSSALLRLLRASKVLLFQHTREEKLNMVGPRWLSWTSSFALMTLSVVWRVANAHRYSIGLRYLTSGLFWVALIWYVRKRFFCKIWDSSSKNDCQCHLGVYLYYPTFLRHLSLITLACQIWTFILQLGTASRFSIMQTPQWLSIATSRRAHATSRERSLVSLFFIFLILEP